MVRRVASGGQPLATQGAYLVLLGHARCGHDPQPRGGVEDVVQGALELGGEVGEVGLAADDGVHHRCQIHVMHDTAQVRRQNAHTIATVGSVPAVVGAAVIVVAVTVAVVVGVVQDVQLRVVVALDASGDEILIDCRLRLAVEVSAENESCVSGREKLLDISTCMYVCMYVCMMAVERTIDRKANELTSSGSWFARASRRIAGGLNRGAC